ncbi:uncharacterized protein L3040_007772 [Drepanopeziza brunnea f. sp. 'multigermtubi']|uniref:DUF7702 domain-containing protein n=1 Tax=Marssonina brunnea f. sp. multigermtubi (strain MB_m1) TaxID=1072389 RepID=K1WUR4_MARBU|nr:uncharacterized protein MBM_05431 [Drepanopeziza brunnea f. sp. 'multigermtubi' MB_m1]EKD16137.1 hypothetical protein MBM_05431 [Drepanopeziza brunnea f. sp. 'multigermtubi' MB_m1]KAJ5035297.1 hypothetical protein L3040_007772 [Drepanopeziza brunnea f. sp. 'multigermtubi']
MSFTEENILSVATIAFYSPTVPLSVYLCLRHGFSPNTGFLFLIFFSLIRIVGGALDLATIHSPTEQKAGVLHTVALVLSFTGLSPLLLSTLGLLYRVRFGMVKIYPTTLKPVHLVLVRVPVVAALVLCDEGAIDVGLKFAATGHLEIPLTSRVGVVIFLAVSLIAAFVALSMLRIRSRFGPDDRYVLYAITASLPLIWVRLIYGFLGAYISDPEFGFLGGNMLLMGCMSILPEMLVVIIYSALGILLPRRAPEPPVEKPKKQPKKKTKTVWRKPWKVVDAEDSPKISVVEVEEETDDTVGDMDRASIMGRLGDDKYEIGKEMFVVPGSKGTPGRGQYLGSMLVNRYLPPLSGLDSGVEFAFEKV